MSQSEPKELTQIKKFIDLAKFDEADKLIKKFEEKEGHNLYDNVLCQRLKCELLRERGLSEEAVKLAEETYKESLRLGTNLLSVDILLIMGHALLTLGETDKPHDIATQLEELLKSLTQESPAEYKQREAYLAYIKGWVYQRSDFDQALHQFEHSLSLRDELGAKKETNYTLIGIAQLYMDKGDYDQALISLERSLKIAEESGNKGCIGYSLHYMAIYHAEKGELDRSIKFNERSLTIYKELNNKFGQARVLNHLAGTCWMKGELDHSIRYYEQCLELFKEFNNKFIMAFVFNSLSFCHKMKGELDRALECIEHSMALNRELGVLGALANNYDYLIQILIDRGEFERARISLGDLEQLVSQLKSKPGILQYRFNKALVLKTSSRALNRGKAEEIFKQLLEEEDLLYEFRILVLLNLCELLLADLQITNEVEILEEIKPLIAQLLDLSEKSHSFWVLGETYLLQAKLALISLNLEEARRLLSQGQQITEKYGLNELARKISNEHDQVLKQLEIWEKKRDSKAPLAERIELSLLNEQMERMVKRRIGKPPKLEAEQPVLLTVMSKDGKILLSNPFTADITIDSTFFSEFLSSCNTFCDQILSESFDRMKFGQHTVLITTVHSFSICYMFQGQSYSARQKLLHFSEAVKKDPGIMKNLKDASSKNIEIRVHETASLEELIFESFLSDPQQFQMPFKAYDGDGPFVFVSYSHTDRLQVYPIIDYLNKTGTNIWYDEGIPVGEDWKGSIVNNLERCSAFLVFISPQIVESEYVRKEISFALKKEKPFFSVYLKETELPNKLEFEIGDIQSMKKYLMSDTEFYPKLRDVIYPTLHKQEFV